MRNLQFLKVFNSPFKRPKLRWYFGKTQLGVPYFFPRKWVKATPEMAKKRALEEIENVKNYNERNAKYGNSTRVARTFEEYYQQYLRYDFPIPKKIGFDFVELGWKTKWTETDYRFEWAPVWSFVFLKWQIAIMFIAPEQPYYWQAWLYYHFDTDKSKSKAERIAQCREHFSLKCTITSLSKQTSETIDYYNKILKKKYL